MLNQSNNFQNNLFSNQPNVQHENPLSLGDTNEPEEVANFADGGLAMEEPVPFELSKKEKAAKILKGIGGKDNIVSMILSHKGRNERVKKQKEFNDLKAKNALQEKTEMQNRFASLESNIQNLNKLLENKQSSDKSLNIQQPITQPESLLATPKPLTPDMQSAVPKLASPTAVASISPIPDTTKPPAPEVVSPANYFKGGRIDGIAKRGKTRCKIL